MGLRPKRIKYCADPRGGALRAQRAGSYVGALAAVIAAAGLLAVPAHAQRGTRDGEWPNYAGNREGMKYSPLDQITKDNVGDLEVAWRWPTADQELQASNPAWRGGRYEDTPLLIDGLLYTVTPLGLVSALDPATGETQWVHDPKAYTAGRPANVGFLHRGLAYWTDGTEQRLLLGTNDARLVSIDLQTGEPDPNFGVDGSVDIMVGIRDAVRGTNFAARRALIAGDVVVVGNAIADGFRTKEMPPGDVQAYDVRTGRKLWTFHTIPKEYEAGYETWLNGSAEYTGNANVWNGMAYDPELDYVYLPTSTPTHNEYGGNRPGDNLYAESLVCVDAKTGERIWHFQAVHHGIWDYDFAQRPILADITVDGRPIKAVIQVSKQAFTYVFDRVTGEPVWPIEERPVPQSTVPGERTAPTQPFPTKPPPFDIQGTTEDTLLDFTPELREMALERLQQFEYGPLFTPPSEKGTIFLPGLLGGNNWGGAGFDPETSMLYVPSRTGATMYRLLPGNPAQTNLGYVQDRQRGIAESMTLEGLPLFKPPYSRMTAIDMSRGEIAWQSAMGNGPRNHPLLQGLDLPPLGNESMTTSVLVTKSLVFGTMTKGRTPDRWGDEEADRQLLYAFDKEDGAHLRTFLLDGRSAAAPMTYMHEGKQYIVVATGAANTAEQVALSLP
ncbi:MAG: PQQ-binding-like beta-propeller repeat protein [Acidobacteria bacterium]|nr:PQQ-binding-like beta-propeller repeat protein [Acidobacteriota bacterium]